MHTQDNKEFLLDVPVAATARIVPSSCSCIVFLLTNLFDTLGAGLSKNGTRKLLISKNKQIDLYNTKLTSKEQLIIFTIDIYFFIC